MKTTSERAREAFFDNMGAAMEGEDWFDRASTSVHPDGHSVGEFPDGWWFYPSGYAGPRNPGPQAAGPFKSREAAKAVLETLQCPQPRLFPERP